MSPEVPGQSDALEAAVDRVLARVGRRIVLGTPLGIGKPNPLLNAVYRRARRDPSIQLKILTALSLTRPRPGSDLERRFLEPFAERQWGGHVELDYAVDRGRGRLPDNVEVVEFYFRPGSMVGHSGAQRSYISSNYTHVARDMVDHGVNVIAQAVASRSENGTRRLSLSSNPDLTLDFVRLLEEAGRRDDAVLIAQVNERMPWLGQDAEVSESFFDEVVDEPGLAHEPFAVPNMPVDRVDHAIGFWGSALLRDGGTLQVGIGSLGDAFVHATRLRDSDNDAWRRTLSALGGDRFGGTIDRIGGRGRFRRGLYAASEMMSWGLMCLFDDGLVRRRVYEQHGLQRLADAGELPEKVTPDLLDRLVDGGHLPRRLDEATVRALVRHGLLLDGVAVRDGELVLPDGERIGADLADPASRRRVAEKALGERIRNGVAMHGAFLLGPRRFYQRLRELDDDTAGAICMTAVSEVNRVYTDYELERLQRRHPRFVNSAMKMTLLGAAVSDQLESGQVISGVGGQYNFVAMAHQLPEGRSVLNLRSTREGRRGPESNIVWQYGHHTIPRHLRDIVVTEYGIADVRGCTDEDTIKALISIADSRFQPELVRQAQAAGKLASDWRVPAEFADNRPARLAPLDDPALFPRFPLGTDLTETEQVLGRALKWLEGRARTWRGRIAIARAAITHGGSDGHEASLERMALARPRGIRERLLRRLVVAALERVERD